MTKPHKVRVGVYVRLSEVRPGEEAVSLATQEHDARALADRKGWAVAEVYVDRGRSAWKDNRDRPAFNRMLADLQAGKIGGLVAWKQDRIGRRVAEVAALLDRCRQLGAVLATVVDGIDTTTHAGRMVAHNVAAMAEMESGNISDRVRRALQARAERGDAHGGRRGYGYRREGGRLVIDEAEARVIRDIVARLLRGEPVGSILRDLNARNVKTSTGRAWTRRSLVNTATSARIAGVREYDGRDVEGSWEAIISRADHEAIRAALAPSTVHRSAPRSYFLSGGILVCGRCGQRMKGRAWDAKDGRPARRTQYACAGTQEQANGCGLAVTAAPIESFIGGVVIAKLSSRAFRRRLEAAANDAGVDDLYRRLGKLDAAADDLASAFGAGEIDRRAYRVANERNEAERTALQRELRARIGERSTILAGAPTTEAALESWWESAAVHDRHALTAAIIDEIRVGPAVRGKRFDPDRLDITWRGAA